MPDGADLVTDIGAVTVVGDVLGDSAGPGAMQRLRQIPGVRGLMLTPAATTILVDAGSVDDFTRLLHEIFFA